MFTTHQFKTTAFAVLISALTFSSCKKDDVVQPPAKSSMLITEYAADGEVYKFTYNADSSLKTLTLSNDPLSGGENVTYTVKYAAGKKMDELTGSNGAKIKMVYTNNLLTKAETFLGATKIAVSTYTYTGSVLKTTEISLVDGNESEPFFKGDFVFNAVGNATRTNVYVLNPLTGVMEQGGHINMQYDDKPNAMAALGDIVLVFWQVSTKNNITRQEYINKDGSREELIETTYTYNPSGYPTRAAIKTTEQGQQPVNTTHTFTYKQ